MSLPIGNERRGLGLGPHPHDPRVFDVAAFVARLIEEALPGTVVEHVGSSAVPRLAGKNIVDLMIAAEPSQIPEVTEALLSLGFQPQSDRDPSLRRAPCSKAPSDMRAMSSRCIAT